jgi:Ca-activated chloride channel homolog
MTFLWPQLLWLLALAPAAVLAYILILRRQKKKAARYASLRIVSEAFAVAGTRQHLPPSLLLVAFIVMLAAAARPAAVVRLPSHHEIVILAMDVSGSMQATDVAPDRMTAARNAAKAFVAEQPGSTRIGLVAFSGDASLVQAPTGDREEINTAIDRLQPQLATAVGSGLLVSLQALFPDAQLDLASGTPHVPARPGSYEAGAIILLSDGETNAGPDPAEAAELAAIFGVRVFTVGFGTARGEMIQGEGWSLHVKLDEQTLRHVAEITGGEYFQASTAGGLKKVYETLNARLAFESSHQEITALFAAAAALAAMLAGGLSLAWFNRVI